MRPGWCCWPPATVLRWCSARWSWGRDGGAYFLPLAALALVGLKLEVLVDRDLFKAELRAPAVKE